MIEETNSAAPGAPALPATLLKEIDDIARDEASAAAAGGAPAAPVDFDAEARDVISFAYESFSPLYPSLEKVYTPEKRERIAKAAGSVMRKHGWTFEIFFDGWGAELHLAIVTLPLIVPTYQAIRTDMAAADAERAAAAKQDPDPAPAAPAQKSAASPDLAPPPNIPLP